MALRFTRLVMVVQTHRTAPTASEEMRLKLQLANDMDTLLGDDEALLDLFVNDTIHPDPTEIDLIERIDEESKSVEKGRRFGKIHSHIQLLIRHTTTIHLHDIGRRATTYFRQHTIFNRATVFVQLGDASLENYLAKEGMVIDGDEGDIVL